MSYLGLKLNLRNSAVSQYSNFDFDAYCSFGGECLACGSAGIYSLGGSDDDGTDIDSLAKTMTMDFGVPNQKRVRSLFIGGEWGGWLKVSISDDDGEVREYLTPPLENSNLEEGNKVAVGRDGKGRYWNFQVENVEGCDFSIDGIDALLVVLNARPAGWTWGSGRHGRADELEIGSIEVEATGTV
jgi:hypothetical protein